MRRTLRWIVSFIILLLGFSSLAVAHDESSRPSSSIHQMLAKLAGDLEERVEHVYRELYASESRIGSELVSKFGHFKRQTRSFHEKVDSSRASTSGIVKKELSDLIFDAKLIERQITPGFLGRSGSEDWTQAMGIIREMEQIYRFRSQELNN